jgi:hypothetical protein
MRTSSDNGVSFDSTAGNYSWELQQRRAATWRGTQATSSTAISLNGIGSTETLGNASTESWAATIRMTNMGSSAFNFICFFLGTQIDSDSRINVLIGSGRREETARVNAIQFYMSSGSIFTGEMRLYGWDR